MKTYIDTRQLKSESLSDDLFSLRLGLVIQSEFPFQLGHLLRLEAFFTLRISFIEVVEQVSGPISGQVETMW